MAPSFESESSARYTDALPALITVAARLQLNGISRLSHREYSDSIKIESLLKADEHVNVAIRLFKNAILSVRKLIKLSDISG
jgi:hypothetical protein